MGMPAGSSWNVVVAIKAATSNDAAAICGVIHRRSGKSNPKFQTRSREEQMACSAAVTFCSFPIFTSYIELHPKTSAHRACPSLWSSRASFSFISSACIRTYTATSSLSSVGLIRVPCRDVFVLLPYTDATYCPRMLCGYWVGPDTEDGWGFVEAFISECL